MAWQRQRCGDHRAVLDVHSGGAGLAQVAAAYAICATGNGCGCRAMAAVAILQLLLVAGVLEFDVQVVLVAATFLVVYAWVIAVSSTGHRHGTLPRSVTRFGLLLGASYPVGLVIAAAGLLFPSGSATQLAFVVPGVVIAAIGWLGLPVWPLVLARLVFSKPPLHMSYEEGMS